MIDPDNTVKLASESPTVRSGKKMATSYESQKLNGLVRNWSALAVLVLAYSKDWMDLFDAGRDVGLIRATGISMSAPGGARQSIVLTAGDMEVFGIPLTMAFVALLLSAVLRVVYPQKRRLHPLIPLAVALPGTLMLGTILGYAIHDGTVKFFTSGFYFALTAFGLNTLFDFLEYLDWRALGRAVDIKSASPST